MPSRYSHEKTLVECDFNYSEKCEVKYVRTYKDYMDNKDRNNGRYMCLHCSRQIKYVGRNNPNCKFKNLDDNFFREVDTWEKAYILGWVASDGSIAKKVWSVSINIKQKDIDVLMHIRSVLDTGDIKLSNKKNMCYITINSKQICIDICKLLQIERGKKSYTVKFPHSIPKELYKAFIQGYFEGDGNLSGLFTKNKYLKSGITSSSIDMLTSIIDIVGINCCLSTYKNCHSIHYSNSGAFKFLDYIYNHNHFKMYRKYHLYEIWKTYERTSISSKQGIKNLNEKIKVCKTHQNAVLPSKAHDTDAGYDLTIIEKVRGVNSSTALYSTGLKFQFFEAGWYLALYARSSLIKSGYILTNSVGIIDGGFMGTVLVSLTKINAESPDIQLPAKIAQIIPQQLHTLDIMEVSEDNFSQTTRGDGGFGSSDAQVQSTL